MTCANTIGNQEETNRQLQAQNSELTKSVKEIRSSSSNVKHWCNLGSLNVIATALLSTKKSLILIEQANTWRQAYNTCKSICGSLYFPSTRIEYNEVSALIKNHGGYYSGTWLRISDREIEGHWKDPDNKESFTFTDWVWYEPNNYGGDQHWGYMRYDGYWGDESDTFTRSYLVCELT